uniref:Uncharacterized protein n=1 Tax=Romanomermis culicivorax TaxID=13658 RepID=A0A915HQE1_ROMCU
MQNDASHMESSSPLPRIDVAQANSSTTSATGAKKSRRSQPFFQMVTINGTRKCINKLSKKRVYMGKCDPTYKKAPNKKIRSARFL